VATVSGALTFTAGNWNTAQTVTLTGAQDGDTEDETVTISHTVSGADYGSVQAAPVVVTVSDDDTPQVSISVAALTVAEGAQGTYTLQLGTQPTGAVTVTPSSGDANVATVSGALTFTAGTWNTGQSVTVTGAEDANAVDNTVVVSHAVTGADYAAVTAAGVQVTVTDNEPPLSFDSQVGDQVYTEGQTITTLTLQGAEFRQLGVPIDGPVDGLHDEKLPTDWRVLTLVGQVQHLGHRHRRVCQGAHDTIFAINLVG